MSDRLKAEIWVKAQLRILNTQMITAMIVHKGDADSGSVLIKHNRFSEGCSVFTPITTMDGAHGWMHGLKGGYVHERDADAYIQRQLDRDSDLWVIEVEDQKNQFELDGPLVE